MFYPSLHSGIRPVLYSEALPVQACSNVLQQERVEQKKQLQICQLMLAIFYRLKNTHLI